MSKNITLVLSGGGARGIAHIGVIEEMESRGYAINSIAGTSMGALVGGVYAAGKLKELKEWLYTLDKQKIFSLLDFNLGMQGFIKGDRVLNAMRAFVPDTEIESLRIKFTATAFDLANEKEVVFSTGNLYQAIRASISIPTIFTPVISGNSILVDGGVVNNIPVKNAVRTDNDELIAVNVNANIKLNAPTLASEESIGQTFYAKSLLKFKSRLAVSTSENQEMRFNYFNLITNTILSTTNQLAQMTLLQYPPKILIEISRNSAGTFEFFKAQELVELGRAAAKKAFDSV